MKSVLWILHLLTVTHFVFACKFLRSIPILEANSLQKFNSPNYIHALAGVSQEISVNLSKLFQDELSISESQPLTSAIFFTDASESRPFVIKQTKDGSRVLSNELPLDREDICNPFKFPHRATVARKCCSRHDMNPSDLKPAGQRDFKCCLFLGITVEGFGSFALKIDVIDANDNRPQFKTQTDSILSRPGKEDLAVIKITENTQQGTLIPLPRVVDLDEGKNADLLYQIEKVNSKMDWEQHFKLLSTREDKCITKLSDGQQPQQQQMDTSFPALCLLRTIDRETGSGFAFDLVARDQGEPIALSSTLSMSIMVIDENDNAPIFTQSEFKVSVKENEMGKTLVHLHVSDHDVGENARLSYYLRPGSRFVSSQAPSPDFLRMHILASPAPDGVMLRLTQPLDYETIKGFDFQVVVKDHGMPPLASTATVVIEVLNTNDQPPVIRFFNKGNLLNSDYPSLERLEDTENGFPIVICHVHVSDEDSNLEDLFCDISSPQRQFDLREVTTENTVQRRKVYELISLTLLDREKTPSYSVGVRCVDGRTANRLVGQSQIRILLKDTNDNGPIFERSQYFGIVPENEENALVDFKDSAADYRLSTGTVVAPSHIRATDADSGPNAAVRFSLAAWGEDGGNTSIQDKSDHELFYIDRVTGHMKTRVALDFEKKSTYRFIVIATDQPLEASQALSSTASVTVTVKDLDDNPPTMLQREYAFDVTEGIPSHSVVGRVEATDADSLPENRAIQYQLRPPNVSPSSITSEGENVSSTGGNGGGGVAAIAAVRFFTVDRNSGVIRTSRPLDREQVSQLMFEVVAHSANHGLSNRFHALGSPSSTATVVVTVLDKNDNPPNMVSLATPEKHKVLLAEVSVAHDGFKGDPACVPFLYGFQDDDDIRNGNGNVSVALEANQNFVFNDDQTHLCLKSGAVGDKGKTTNLIPAPGRYSLNILAQDNPNDLSERHTKRFPLRVHIQTPTQEKHPPNGILRHRDQQPAFKPVTVGTSTAGMYSGHPALQDNGAGGRRKNGAHNTRMLVDEGGVGGSAGVGGGGSLGGEYRSVSIIAVLVCMACILCIILLAILFLRKCPPTKNIVTKGAMQSPTHGAPNSVGPMNLQEFSTEAGQFGTVDRYPDRYPCMDMQSPMLVTLRPGSDKNFTTLSSTAHMMGGVIYADETSRMIPMSPRLTQKNNLTCHAGNLRKVAVSPIYGPPSTSAHVISSNISKPALCSSPLGNRFAPPSPQSHAAEMTTESQTYGLLLPSKSYDELHQCSSTLHRQQPPGGYKTPYRPTFVIVRKQHPVNQDDYQSPLSQTSVSEDYTPISVAPVKNATLSPLPPPSDGCSMESGSDPLALGQASFV